jgi:cobalt/nickel transport system permease protein
MENKIPAYLLRADSDQYKSSAAKSGRLSFLNRTLINAAGAAKSIYVQAENAAKKNLIHRINPHVKLISLIYLEIVISLTNSFVPQAIITGFIFLLYIIARLDIFQVYRKILILAFVFGFVVIFPASLNVITPGNIIFNLVSFNKPSHFWIYNIPQNIGFTKEGIQVVLLLFLRVLNSVSFALLIVFTTSFPAFIKSFKIIGVPDTFLMIITLAYKYIFILCRAIEDTFLSLKSRLISNVKNKTIRKLISGLIFLIFKRSVTTYENTYYAMVSRGYRGKVVLHSSQHFTLGDFVALIIIVAFGIGIILI